MNKYSLIHVKKDKGSENIANESENLLEKGVESFEINLLRLSISSCRSSKLKGALL